MKTARAAENFDTYLNLQPHRAVLPAIARHLVKLLLLSISALEIQLSLSSTELNDLKKTREKWTFNEEKITMLVNKEQLFLDKNKTHFISLMTRLKSATY